MSMTVVERIEEIVKCAEKIKALNHPKIAPGETVYMSPALTPNDAVRQGDLYLIVATEVPSHYFKVDRPTELDRQLVPGNTEGSRHALVDLTTVDIYRHSGWNSNYDGLAGPYLVTKAETIVDHPTHGKVVIPPGFTIECFYQRELDAELRRERRNAD